MGLFWKEKPPSYNRRNTVIQPLPETANLSKKYFILSKVYSEEGGIKKLYCGLSTCMGDNPLAKLMDYLLIQVDKPPGFSGRPKRRHLIFDACLVCGL